MKIIVKSTKTISFDGAIDSDDDCEESEEELVEQ